MILLYLDIDLIENFRNNINNMFKIPISQRL